MTSAKPQSDANVARASGIVRTPSEPGSLADHPILRHPATGVQVRVGVMGSAAAEQEPGIRALCRALGRAVALRGACLLTGACPGLPHEAALGAAEVGGHVVGISPAHSLREHVAVFASPYREYGVMIYTGLGLMGRELVNIYSSDAVLVVGGQSGTLGEFAIAFEEGKPIGVLTGTGGIADALEVLAARLTKPTGAVVRYGADPARLVDDLLACLRTNDHPSPHP